MQPIYSTSIEDAEATYSEAENGAVWSITQDDMGDATTHQVTIKNVDCTAGTVALFVIPRGFSTESVAVKDEGGTAISIDLSVMSTQVTYIFDGHIMEIALATSGTDGSCKVVASGW